MATAMRKFNPQTLSDFRKLGKKRLAGKTPEEARNQHDLRQKLKAQLAKIAARPSVASFARNPLQERPACVLTIQLGSHTLAPPAQHARKKNWRPQLPTTAASYVQKYDCGQYSSRCTYKHWEYQQYVTSWGAVVNGQLFYRIATDNGLRHRILTAPRGWTWALDEDGIHLAGPRKMHYHPTAHDLLRCTLAELCVRARELGRLRKQLDRERRDERKAEQRKAKQERDMIRRAEAAGVMIGYRDARSAGNCAAGVATWAQRHGLDTSRHYGPRELLAQANGDARQVVSVIAVALRRHEREMQQGVCMLVDHRTTD